MAELTREQLEKRIAQLDEIGESEAADKYRAQLAQLEQGEGKQTTPTPKSSTKGGAKDMAAQEGKFTLPVTEEEYQEAGSKFAAPGAHLSEMGMPYWKVQGQSFGFPFTIIEDGPDQGKEGEYFVGVGKNAIWKLKEILGAVGVEPEMVKGGDGKRRPSFDPDAVSGKRFQSIWTTQRDTRPPEEGGKGTTYTKPTSAAAEGANVEELGY